MRNDKQFLFILHKKEETKLIVENLKCMLMKIDFKLCPTNNPVSVYCVQQQ